MIFEKAVERSFAIVGRALRQTFPDDYHRRCMYAAFGMQSLLGKLGHQATIFGGDIMGFVVSRSGDQAAMHGCGTTDEGHGHFWLHAGGRLVDIGPHYLPYEASLPSEPMPLIAWDLSEPIPPFVRYRAQQDLGPKTVLVSDARITARMESFVQLCERKLKAQVGQPKSPSWLLTSTASLLRHGERGERWVHHAMRFCTMRDAVADLPF
jgi:hypothetical protein